MAHKKGVGSSRNGRDSQGQRRGVKAFSGQVVPGGSIIVRQCGSKYYPGENVGMGKDNTLFAKISGRIEFYRKGRKKTYIRVHATGIVHPATHGTCSPETTVSASTWFDGSTCM